MNNNIILFETMFNKYYTGLVAYASQITNDSTVAEDIVCEVFTSIWEKKEFIEKNGNKAYLFTAVKNRSLNYLIHLKIRNHYQENILQKGDVTGMLTWEYYVESELEEYIEQAIRNLPPRCQKIFIMNRLEDKSAAQIAEELQISPRTVEKQIEIAVKKLRIDLADYLSIAFLISLLKL